MALGWVQQHHLGRVGSPRVRGRGCCDSSLDMGLQRTEKELRAPQGRRVQGSSTERKGAPTTPGWGAPRLRAGGVGSYLGNMGHVGEAVGQLLVGMDGIYSGWLGEAALRGLGRRSRWQRRRRACQGPWVVQVLLRLSTAQVWGLPRLVLPSGQGER